MTTNDHIAAIKWYLKAIEAEVQKLPKKEPKRYFVVEVKESNTTSLLARIYEMMIAFAMCSCDRAKHLSAENFIRSGKIITVNE